MSDIVAIYGSPRRNGNTAMLLKKAVQGARDSGAQVDEIFLRDYKISPCLEIYGCRKDGECVIKDDFQNLRDRVLASRGVIIATPVFFYTVSAHVKIFMDRFQSLWVKKFWVEGDKTGRQTFSRKGLVIAVGATKGKKLFDGLLLTMKYFFKVIDTELGDSLVFRGLDGEGDVLEFPQYLDQAYAKGRDLAHAVMEA